MTDVEIHRTASLRKLKNPLIIVGFPGTGLVGSVAASHIVDALGQTITVSSQKGEGTTFTFTLQKA